MYIYTYIFYIYILQSYIYICVCVYTYMKYMRERGFLEGTGSHSYRSYKVQNLQCELAGCIPKKNQYCGSRPKTAVFNHLLLG